MKLPLAGLASLTSASLFMLANANAQNDPYGYACVNCPANWENLAIGSNNCGGFFQSPIAFDEVSARGPRSPRLDLDYGLEFVEPEFTQTNIEWGAESGHFAWLDGEPHYFSQFHFHTTAEHVVNGERSDLEMHFVNRADDGHVVVVGAFILEGQYNDAFAPITDVLPGAEAAVVDLRSLLPQNLSAFAYTGSTTTPPCSAGVEWRLLATPVRLSEGQIAAIRNDIWAINQGFDNNRPIQSRQGRDISQTGSANQPRL